MIAIVAFRRSEAGRAKIDALLLKLPVAGSLLQAAIVERTCRVLSSLVTAGVDLPRAMAVTAESSNNAVYNAGHQPHPRADDGREGLGAAPGRNGSLPCCRTDRCSGSARTGTLDKQLDTAANFYHRELETKVKHFTSLFEPAVIIFMGLLVGFVAVAMVSAMYGIYRQVNVSGAACWSGVIQWLRMALGACSFKISNDSENDFLSIFCATRTEYLPMHHLAGLDRFEFHNSPDREG